MTTEPASASPNDPRVRKRTAIGLAPLRPTAKVHPQRPPRAAEPRGCAWSMVVLVALVIVVTSLLVSVRLPGSPLAWPQMRAQVMNWIGAAPAATENGDQFRLLLADEFTGRANTLPDDQQTDAGTLHVVPAQGVYQLQVEPDRMVWSTIGANNLPDYRMEASFTIATASPAGSGGLVARYQDKANFYLFAIDGLGRLQVQLLRAGVMQTVKPWKANDSIHPAGQANQLVLIDDGAVLRLFINSVVVYEAPDPALPAGDVGIFGAGTPTAGAEVDVDWIRLFALPKGNSP